MCYTPLIRWMVQDRLVLIKQKVMKVKGHPRQQIHHRANAKRSVSNCIVKR